MKMLLGLVLAILLCACNTTAPAPVERIVVQTVDRPVPVSCVPPGAPEHQPPRTATPEALARAGIDAVLTAVTAELVRRRAYDDAAEVVIAACRRAAATPSH